MTVQMELKIKDRNMFLWREILWQLRLLMGGLEQREAHLGNKLVCKCIYTGSYRVIGKLSIPFDYVN